MVNPRETTEALGRDNNISRPHTTVPAEHLFEVSDGVNGRITYHELLNNLHVAFPEFEQQELSQKAADELKHISSWIEEDIQEPFSSQRTSQKGMLILWKPDFIANDYSASNCPPALHQQPLHLPFLPQRL
jgi:hypothetical protein